MLAALLTAAAALYLLCLAVYLVARALGRARAGPLGLLRELTPYLLLPAGALLVAGVVLRVAGVAVLGVASLVLAIVALKPLRLVRRRRAPPPAASTRFRILTLNAGGNAGAAEPPRLEQVLGAVDADIVALQELTPGLLSRLRRSLGGRYAYSEGEWPAIVFSRFPIRACRTLRFPSRGSDAQRVDIDIAGRALTLFNVHITRPHHELDGRLARLWLLLGYDPAARDTHAALMHAHIGRVPGACVLAGDLNATEWSHPYRLLATTLVDAFRESGRGWGNTYRAGVGHGRRHLRVPVARIDYIFHSRDLVTLEARLGPDSGSDHLPVVADLAFR